MKLLATKRMRYANCDLLPGEEFEASAQHAKILKAIKKATDAPQRAATQTYKTRRLRADDDRNEPDDVEDRTRVELLAEAENRNLDLPAGYVRKDELIELIGADDAKVEESASD